MDECVKFMTEEFDAAAKDLPARYTGTNYGRIDAGACKAYKAKILLYAASPFYNGNKDLASVKNPDGTNLFPQEEDATKWDTAKAAFEDFFNEYGANYALHEVYTDGKYDPYESYRQVTTGCELTSKENIFIREVWHGELNYAVTPYHNGYRNGYGIDGGLGLGTSQEMVDLFFTDKGLRIDDDPDYKDYGLNTTPSAEYYGWDEDYNDPVVPTRNYFKQNTNLTLKQWANREPRFYVCVTYNGSTWLNTETTAGEVTTELYYNGNSGNAVASHDCPYTGYGMRKTARSSKEAGQDGHFSCNLRLAEMYLGYAETLSATSDFDGALEYVNKVRRRAGIAEYGDGAGQIWCPKNRTQVDNRIRRERMVELCFESARFFDVRRWKIANGESDVNGQGDGWVYPTYHTGGEGGDLHGLDYRSDPPQFFQKVVMQTRTFEPRHYLMPIPDAEVRRNPHMVQNYDWNAEV